MKYIHAISITVLVGMVIGGLATYGLVELRPDSSQESTLSKEQLIREYYETEQVVHVSPHSLRRRMDKGEKNFILVDVRSPQEYEKEHIIGAVNIPAYKDPDTSIHLDTDAKEQERIINEFKTLPSDKEIILYCYSTPCMTGRKMGKLLANNGVYVKTLNIGWNEWRYHWTLWNHEHEWNTTKPEEYIGKGKEPGEPKVRELPSPCGAGELGC